MDAGTLSIPQNGTVPVADIVSARVSQNPITIPVNSGSITRLQNIIGLPHHGGGGHSLSRLQAIDALISRIRGAQEHQQEHNQQHLESMSVVERHEHMLEEVAERIVHDVEAGRVIPGITEGLLLDIAV